MTPEALADLHARAMTVPPPWDAASFRDLLASPGVFPVARGGGFALGRVIGDEAELLTIAVAPEARRQGVGRSCLAGFEAAARTRGATHAFLEVAADNAAALALYRGGGWREVGRRKGYYRTEGGKRTDAIVMRRSL